MAEKVWTATKVRITRETVGEELYGKLLYIKELVDNSTRPGLGKIRGVLAEIDWENLVTVYRKENNDES